MHRRTFIAAGAVGAALAVPAVALAQIIEIGQGAQQATPSCPAKPCLAVSRTTGYQAKVNSAKGGFTTVKQDGRIVAWSIALGAPTAKQVDFFEKYLGGEATAQITILKPGKKWHQRVVAQGEARKLQPYFGTTPQFALQRSIPVKKGWIVALTVPTWAPALADNLGDTTEWRASRATGKCDDTQTQTAQTRVNTVTAYSCVYKARLTYSATIIPDPKPATPPKK
jgi:hypothetical protein